MFQSYITSKLGKHRNRDVNKLSLKPVAVDYEENKSITTKDTYLNLMSQKGNRNESIIPWRVNEVNLDE